MNQDILAYYRFEVLPEQVKRAHKIRSKTRLDCVAYCNTAGQEYKGLENFVNKKGQLFLYKVESYNFVSADSKRLSMWSLTNNSLNLSSIYIEDIDFPEIGYGYPNDKTHLSNGKDNPLYAYRNDAYLFFLNKDLSVIEMVVIQDGKNLVNIYYQMAIDGAFDEHIQQLRQQARPFYQYELSA